MQINHRLPIMAFVLILLVRTLNAQHTYIHSDSICLQGKEVKKTDYSIAGRHFTGIPSLAISNRGQLWAVWYAGITPAEDLNNYVVVATSSDKGRTWKEVLIIDPDNTGPLRAFDPQVWIDPDGVLWVFWAQHTYRDSSRNTALLAITTPDANIVNPVWSKPRQISNGVMMGKPIVLSGGEWVLPVSFWHLKEGSAKMILSADRGRTWQIRGSVNVTADVRSHDEHAILEKNDGSLWMLVRTKYGIGESTSQDGGKNWSLLTPSGIMNPSSRFFIRRLRSGNILLVKNGPVNRQTNRSHLMAYISTDEGRSWSKGLLLHEAEKVSYPDGQQSADGTIYIIYDYNRTKDKCVFMASFSEEDLLDENHSLKMVEVYNRRTKVSEGGKYYENCPAVITNY